MTVHTNQPVDYLGTAVTAVAKEKACSDARIWNRVADRYAAKPVAAPDAYRHKLDVTRGYLHENAEVLEIGCGTGSTALAHAPFVKHIRATDFSLRMIEIAEERRALEGVANVDFVCSSVADEIKLDVKVDVVLALNLLHVLADWEHTIEAMYDMIKPGGVCVTSTICLNDGAAFMRPIAKLGQMVGVIPQLSFFNIIDLQYAMSKTGFDIEYAWQPAPKKAVFMIARKAS
ncbi:MAG: class I SAM-dependent methyltransferase [Acidiferrobacterales bacterium]|nr:class I SAM-dependent methyltransferase [Acidiferrobacterales bacterium]